MARVSFVKNLTIGILRSGRLTPLGHGHLVRFLSDKSDKSFDQVQSNLKRAEKEKPSAQTDPRLVWPDARSSEFKERTTHDTFPTTWDFKNNELDVEQLAGLPGPREADDPYSSSENEQENWEHEEFMEELQFGRMLALRGQLNRELSSSESERRSLDAVRQSVDFMMQELSQISFMLRFLHPQENDANSISQGDCALENVYSEPLMGSWVYTHPGESPKNAYADVSNVEEVVQEFQQNQESPVTTSEGEGQLSSDQETEALDEVIAADDSHKKTPNDTNSISQGDYALENVYSEPLMGSSVYTHPGESPKNAYADVSNVKEVVQEFQENQESPVTTSEGKGQLSSDQETEALDEVIAADDSHKKTPNDTNSISQGDYALENVYSEPLMGSWVYTHPGESPTNAYADVSNVKEVVQEFQENQESPVTTSEGKGQLSSDQETEALDEVIAADDSHKKTPTKPPQSTPNTNPNPSKDARQVPQSPETIHTYKPFRTIEVPAPKPSQSLSTEANAEQVPVQDETAVEERAENSPKKEDLPVQDETAVEERAENSPKKEGYTFSTQLSESESRILMHMALKQALSDLESGKTNYKATILLTDDVESHDVN